MISEAQLTAVFMMSAAGLSAQRIADALELNVELVRAALNRYNSHDQGQDGGYI